MGIFDKRSNEQARMVETNGAAHPVPTHGDHTYPAETGYASHPAHSKNNGPLGNHGAVTGYHKAAPVATGGPYTNSAHPAPLIGGNNPCSSPRSSAESRDAEREAMKLARKGKTKDTMGSLLHNSRMKREGEQLKAQSEHLKMQATELNEAARLEQEAGMRRQRAVGLGADPVLASGTNGFSPANPHARR